MGAGEPSDAVDVRLNTPAVLRVVCLGLARSVEVDDLAAGVVVRA